jgi:zinc transport system substrate-binding protein
VATDITPVHSLVAKVMAGVGKPDLVIRPGASPHGYSMRPSEAEALQRADVVFWVSHELTPWLESPLENLAGSANKVELLEVAGVTLHEFREGATFEAHEHHDDEHDQHGHDDHAHNEEHDHDEEVHNEAHKEHDEHHHGEHDPHAWLDPENAKIWLKAIAAELSTIDSANATTYQLNANAAINELDTLIASIRTQTKDLHDIKFIVFHDAYQYFERRFDVQATGAISIGDASDPSPARVKEIRDTVSKLGVLCVFTEPQYNPQMVRSVFEDTQVRTIGVMDPLGADIKPGKGLYSKLLKALVSSLNQCQN